MSSEADDTPEHWKNKCKELEGLVKTLSTHCFQVVEKHEELVVKYKANEAQYEAVVARLKDTDDKLAKMGNLFEPVYIEYEMMKNKFEIEAGCRKHAEQYASRVTQQNKVLKRQSQMMLETMNKGLTVTGEISLDDVEPTPPAPADGQDAETLPNGRDPQQDYIESLDAKLKSLEENDSSLKTELDSIKKDLEIATEKKSSYSHQNERLREEAKELNQSLQQHKEALKRLANASESAFQEYEQLKGSYEQEVICRDEAEKCAAKLFAQREAAKRQSTMLLMNVAGDEKLMKAMLDVETLTTQVEEQKAHYERQIEELQEDLKTVRDKEALDSLEQENVQLTEERVSLQNQLSSLKGQVTSTMAQYDKLLAHYKDLEVQLEEAKRPKPPPPPPLPPPAAPKKTSIFSRGKKKKEIIDKVQKGGAAISPSYNKALEEMMQRIKDGKPLKRTLKTRRPSCPDETDHSAMSELRGLLSNMKKASSESDLTAASGDDNTSELAQVFRKIRRPSNSDQEDEWSEEKVVLRSQTKSPPKVAGKPAKGLSRVSEGDETFKD
ncbi:hypothetical protein ACOMHN_065623 [Nucella lapillus]